MVLSDVTRAVCHVERNLRCLQEMPRVGLTNIKDFRGAQKKKRRVGRGPGSGLGKTSGKGHKGQGQRGTKPRIGFEGGQTPFYRLVPKVGFTNKMFKNEFRSIGLNRLQYFIDSKRIDPDQAITNKTLWESGAVSGNIKDGIKLLGSGCTWFQAKVNIEVNRASKTAIEAVERNGGTIKCVYHDRLQLRALLKPEKYPILKPRPARPKNKYILWYSDPDNRGFLADPEEVEKRRQENVKLGKVTEKLENIKLDS